MRLGVIVPSFIVRHIRRWNGPGAVEKVVHPPIAPLAARMPLAAIRHYFPCKQFHRPLHHGVIHQAALVEVANELVHAKLFP